MTCDQSHDKVTQKNIDIIRVNIQPKAAEQYWYRQLHRPANRCPRILQQAMPQKPATNRTWSLPLHNSDSNGHSNTH
jgi:hypothetical protein